MAKRIDLTGRTFGDWKVLEYAENRQWLCECSCGKIVKVDGGGLRRGSSKSCGHNTTARKDIVGQKFGEWTVSADLGGGYCNCECSCGTIRKVNKHHLLSGRSKSCGHINNGGFTSKEYIQNNKKEFSDRITEISVGDIFGEWELLEKITNGYWICRCSCGEIRNVSDWSLKIGKSKSCGHNQLESLNGRTFGEWSVIEYGGESMWICKCSCGETRRVRRTDLLNGSSKSCGHAKTNIKRDLTGEKFGELEVIEYLGNMKYKCLCSCGNITEVLGCNLQNGGTITCGCGKESKYTKEYLQDTIDKFEELTGDKPFSDELSELLEINRGYLSRLIKDNELTHRMNRAFRSKYEREIYNYIKSIDDNVKIIQGDKEQLCGYELDLYLPDIKLAIEFNGNYWHSDQHKHSNYHQNKTINCAKLGIRLIHIFEYEWNKEFTRTKLKDIISAILDKKRNVVYARKCELKKIESKYCREFLDFYHLQRAINSKINYGLYYNNELVSLMTFGVPRYNKDYEWEILRYCNKDGVAVVGGAEKLFKNFVRDSKAKNVITYTDISKFTGNVYTKLGFKSDEKCLTKPNYVWVDNQNNVLSRYKTQKHLLIEQGYGEYGESENEIMKNLGYMKIYDSGNLRMIWSI